MALRLTLDIFSGRPNPVVIIAGLEEKEGYETATAGCWHSTFNVLKRHQLVNIR